LLLIVIAGLDLLVFLGFFLLRPLTVTAWFRRIALSRAGLQKIKIPTAAGHQTVWHGGCGSFLVLLHGAGDQAGSWNRVAPELKRRFHLVMPDLAGHGESAPAQGVLGIGTLLAALEQVLDAEPWRDATLLLAGNSLGAWMAMLYARKHPQRVTRVILIDGGPIKGVNDIGLMPKNRAEARRAFDAVLDPSSPKPPGFVLDDVVRVSNSGPISRLMGAGVDDISKYLLENELASFPLPVDLIWGASDRLVPLDYAKRLESQLPHCTLTTIDRCGHAPQFERPQEFTRALLKILGSGSAANVEAELAAAQAKEKP
jgi:pimeloyl-ACP methyl ester carboxylesterase